MNPDVSLVFGFLAGGCLFFVLAIITLLWRLPR